MQMQFVIYRLAAIVMQANKRWILDLKLEDKLKLRIKKTSNKLNLIFSFHDSEPQRDNRVNFHFFHLTPKF